jgi:hypothetical protein
VSITGCSGQAMTWSSITDDCASLYPIRNKSVSKIAWLDHYVQVMTSASLISQVLLLSNEC